MWLLGLLYVIDTAADRLEQEKKGRVPPNNPSAFTKDS